MPNVQGYCTARASSHKKQSQGLLVSYMPLATSSLGHLGSGATFVNRSPSSHGPASKYLAFGGSYWYNPRLTSGQHHTKTHTIGLYDTQEAAAHAVNAAIRALPPDVQRRRHTNPVVDGRLVPKPPRKPRKRRRDEADATPSPRPRQA